MTQDNNESYKKLILKHNANCTIPCHEWGSSDSREKCEQHCKFKNPEVSIPEENEPHINQEFF